jgi:hypothetical protein
MPTEFDALVSSPPSGRQTALLIDHSAYGSHRLLGGAAVPWENPTRCANYFRTAQALLSPDATLADVGAIYRRHLATRADLRAAMATRSRVGYALKTLLTDTKATDAVFATVAVLAETSRQPLVLQVPSPVHWLVRAHYDAGHQNPPAISSDHAESASIYISDWLRRFSELPVSLVLLDGRTDETGVPADDLAAYTPLSNAVSHYRWALALLDRDRIQVFGSPLVGAVVSPQYWHGHGEVPDADFWYSTIPADADPELVLALTNPATAGAHQ